MTWALICLMALACFLALAFLFKTPRAGREAILAALLIGMAGYALQGSPGLPSAPRAADEKAFASDVAMVGARRMITGDARIGNSLSGDSWLTIADALASHGEYADAATILRGATDKNPRDAEAWLALANALVGHADGTLSPAALYAYRHAGAADPTSAAVPYFLGLAEARSGKLIEARAIWADLLAKAPPEAPWRGDLVEKLKRLDSVIRQARAEGAIP